VWVLWNGASCGGLPYNTGLAPVSKSGDSILSKAALYLTCGSAIAILGSIAVSQILLGLALVALLLSGARLRFPPIKLPLAIFIAWTILAVLLSADPRAGTPQIRKMILFFVLLLVLSTLRNLAQVRAVVLIWGCVASISALISFLQFWQKYHVWLKDPHHRTFYDFYVSERITGFMSHWMTFGGEEMIVVLMLLAFLFFSRERKWKPLAWACVGILAVSLVLGMTRSIFLLGLPLGVCYLVWFWRRWLLLLAPVALGIAMLIAPLRERIFSAFQPHGQTDSNEHRDILRRAGLEMVKAHPLFGLGPEQIKPQFKNYVQPGTVLPEGWYGHLHNIYLQFAAERGIPGLLALLWMIGKMLRDFVLGLRRRDLDPEARFVLHGAIAVILGILAAGYFEYNLGDSEVLTMFLNVVALGYVALGTARARERIPTEAAKLAA
jgi:putative inorganic carbon (hco3(-)) transporter